MVFDESHPGPPPPGRWSMFPEGDWSIHVSYEIYEASRHFQTHWVWNSLRAVNGVNNRRCHGVIRCSNVECNALDRPSTKDHVMASHGFRAPTKSGAQHIPPPRCQLCAVGTMNWIRCQATSSIIAHADRTYEFRHCGAHSHAKPPKLRADASKQLTFNRQVLRNVDRTPRQLIAGKATHDHSAPPVTDIDSVFINRGITGYKRRELLYAIGNVSDGPSLHRGGDAFLDAFVNWQRMYPDFIIGAHVLGGLCLVIMQSPWMRSLLQSCSTNSEPINCFVSDAGHKFFKDAYLLVTCIYDELMRSWQPVMFAYTRFLDAATYRVYFFTVLERLVISRDHPEISDSSLAQVCTIHSTSPDQYFT